MSYKPLLFAVFFGGCISAPVDDPIRIDLPVYDQPQVSDQSQGSNDQPQASSNVQVPQSILPENHPGGELDLSTGGNFIPYKLQEASNVLGNSLDSKDTYLEDEDTYLFGRGASYNYNRTSLGPLAPPITKIESAVHETEGLGSSALSVKDNLHNFVAGIFQPKPIVDTIEESEKFGNTGDKFYNAGQVLVKGASNVSSLVNTILEIPSVIFKNIARSTTEKLNNLGGKLIGL